MKTVKNPEMELRNGYLTIKIPFSILNTAMKKPDWSILDKMKGMWRHKKMDALEYQIGIRNEWK